MPGHPAGSPIPSPDINCVDCCRWCEPFFPIPHVLPLFKKQNKTKPINQENNGKKAFLLSCLLLWRLHLDSSVPSSSPQSRKDTDVWGVGPAQGLRDGEGPGHTAHKGRLRELPLVMRVARHQSRLPSEAVDAPSLEVFKVRLAGALSNLV